MELSKRLTAVAGMVTKGNIVCDVGCDHGYVSLYLVQNKISPHVIAMDIRKGPLSHAKQHISMYGLDDYIETRLSDGMEKLAPKEAETLILAGMGGRLMEEIITKEFEKAYDLKELILQPQSEIPGFRKFLRDKGFEIVDEDMVYEEGKFYPLMRVVPCGRGDGTDVCANKPDEAEDGTDKQLYDLYGEKLLNSRHPVLAEYLDFQKMKLTQLLEELTISGKTSEKSRLRLEEVKKELLLNNLARERY